MSNQLHSPEKEATLPRKVLEMLVGALSVVTTGDPEGLQVIRGQRQEQDN